MWRLCVALPYFKFTSLIPQSSTFIKIWLWNISNQINIHVDSHVTEYLEFPFCMNSKTLLPRNERVQQHSYAVVRYRGPSRQEGKFSPEDEGKTSATLKVCWFFCNINWIMSICRLEMYEREEWEVPHLWVSIPLITWTSAADVHAFYTSTFIHK